MGAEGSSGGGDLTLTVSKHNFPVGNCQGKTTSQDICQILKLKKAGGD